MDQVNETLRELKDEGVLDNIAKNYTGTDEEIGKYPYEILDVDARTARLPLVRMRSFRRMNTMKRERSPESTWILCRRSATNSAWS